MMVDDDALCVIVLWRQKSVHPTRIKEAVMQRDRCIADLAQIVEGIAVELPDRVWGNFDQEWLIDGLDGNNDVLHLRLRVLVVQYLERLMSVRETVRIAPSWGLQPLAAVIESILALGRTMQINDDFEASLARPGDGLVEIRRGSLSEGAPWLDVGPVANRNTYHVEARVTNLLEVLERDKGIPVWLERIVTALLAKFLAEGPFVDYRPVGRRVRLED